MGALIAIILAIFGLQILTALVGTIPGGIWVLVILMSLTIAKNNKNKKFKRSGFAESNFMRNSSTSSTKMTRFNKAMRSYFETHDELQLNEHVIVRPAQLAKNRNVELDVFYDNEFICKFSEFGDYFAGTHAKLIDKILTEVSGYAPEDMVTSAPKEEPKVEEPVRRSSEPRLDKMSAAYWIKVIDELNVDIKEETITKDLFETTAMLKQIQMIEEKYPDSKEKLTKLYQYYLPVLHTILEKYVKLATTNASHEEFDSVEAKLRKTILLVNEALKTITMQLCEEDIIDLNSDMSVLESILRRDGLVKEGTIYEKGVNADGQ